MNEWKKNEWKDYVKFEWKRKISPNLDNGK